MLFSSHTIWIAWAWVVREGLCHGSSSTSHRNMGLTSFDRAPKVASNTYKSLELIWLIVPQNIGDKALWPDPGPGPEGGYTTSSETIGHREMGMAAFDRPCIVSYLLVIHLLYLNCTEKKLLLIFSIFICHFECIIYKGKNLPWSWKPILATTFYSTLGMYWFIKYKHLRGRIFKNLTAPAAGCVRQFHWNNASKLEFVEAQ